MIRPGLFLLSLSSLHASPEELIEAAGRNDSVAVQEIVSAGTSASSVNRYGVSALSLACLNGNDEMVKFLLENGVDPNTAQAGNETALMTAARVGSLPIVQLLIVAGADIDAAEHKQQTALMWASAEGHLEVVQSLLEQGTDFRKTLDSGFTAFLFAVREGHREVVSAFLEVGVDSNTAAEVSRGRGKMMRDGTSALVLAIENGHFDLAADLLAAGADPNDLKSGFAPLHVMSWVRKSVRGDGDDGPPPPRGSGEMTSLQCVRALVAAGADVNLHLEAGRGGIGRVDRKGATPFLLAAETCDLALLETLVDLGADPRLGNHVGTVPLLAAAGMGVTAPGEEAGTVSDSIEVIRYLLSLGADLNVTDDRGETVMHAAAYKSEPQVIFLLDELGADASVWNRKNTSGWTPLAITQGHRPGNFRPIATTEAAMRDVMNKRGLPGEK